MMMVIYRNKGIQRLFAGRMERAFLAYSCFFCKLLGYIMCWNSGDYAKDFRMSLYLGGEIFDVTAQPMQLDNHLFLRQGAGLQGHAVFKQVLINFVVKK